MGRGSSGINAQPGYNAQGIMRTVKEDGVFTSFKDKKAVLAFTGAEEWTKYEAPRGDVFIIADGAIKQRDLIRRLTAAGVKHSVLMGQAERVTGTDLFLAPISVKMDNTKTKRIVKTNRRGLEKVTLK